MAQTNGWGHWWWLDELTGERFMLSLVSLPGVAFWWSLVDAYRNRAQRTVSRLLIAATVASAVTAAIMLTLDSQSLSAEQHYSLSGWPTIWFWGVLIVGLWRLARRGFRWIMSRRRSRSQERQPQHA